MAIGLIIAIVLSLCTGGYVGFRIGAYFIRRENDVLKTQVAYHERFSKYWASASTHSFQMSTQAINNQVINTRFEMETIISFLSAFQTRHAAALDTGESKEVSEIIAKAKSIASLD